MKSNFEKAKELACSKCACGYNDEERMKCGHFKPVLEMAKWKDEQFKKVLQALSNKGSAQDFWGEEDLKSLDSDISKVVSDNFWNLV